MAALCWLHRGWPRRLPGPDDWFIAGLLVGSTILFKQVGVLTALALGVWAPMIGAQQGRRALEKTYGSIAVYRNPSDQVF